MFHSRTPCIKDLSRFLFDMQAEQSAEYMSRCRLRLPAFLPAAQVALDSPGYLISNSVPHPGYPDLLLHSDAYAAGNLVRKLKLTTTIRASSNITSLPETTSLFSIVCCSI